MNRAKTVGRGLCRGKYLVVLSVRPRTYVQRAL